MKRLLLGIGIGFLLSFATNSYASNTIMDVVKFPLTWVVSGTVKTLPDEYETLSYKDHIYVPIRYAAEALHGKVEFNGAEQSLHLSLPSLTAAVPMKDYTLTEAEENGDILRVSYHDQTWANWDRLLSFAENVKQGTSDWVRTTRFSDEGKPMISELSYDGRRYWLLTDHSRDVYGEPYRRIHACRKFEQDEKGIYWMKDCSGMEDTTFPGLVPRSVMEHRIQ